jgi:hypothetical protein
MTLTTRHKGKIVGADGSTWEVIALTWFEPPKWGGVLEVQEREGEVRERLSRGEDGYRLVLDDGREGDIAVYLSEFLADDEHPILFVGVGEMSRKEVVHG